METTFPFEEQQTKIFSEMKRPVAEVSFWSEKLKDWVPVKMADPPALLSLVCYIA